LAKKSHQLHEQKIYQICAAMDAVVYGAEKVSTTKRRQLQVLLNRSRQSGSTWTDADHQMVIERLEGKIHQVTPAKPKHLDKLFR
jgi:hypothetical protein